MKQRKNTYSVKQLDKDIKKLKSATAKIASIAVGRVVSQVHIEDTGIVRGIDEVENIPYNIKGMAEGTIVISVNTDNPIELDELVTEASARALDALEQEVALGMKGVL